MEYLFLPKNKVKVIDNYLTIVDNIKIILINGKEISHQFENKLQLQWRSGGFLKTMENVAIVDCGKFQTYNYLN
jgi:hypothetical protein